MSQAPAACRNAGLTLESKKSAGDTSVKIARSASLGLFLVALSGSFARTAAETRVLKQNTSCPAATTAAGPAWPTRYHAQGCVLGPENSARAGVSDINLVFLGPFSGSLGDMTTKVEPMLRAVVQEVEDGAYLPGYRLKLHIYDSMCTTQDATAQTILAFSTGPQKHGIVGDACSGSCMAENDAMMVYNVLQVSPGCTATALSDRARYPYFCRTSPSTRWNVEPTLPLMKQLGWTRVAVIWENLAICQDMMTFFLARVQQERVAGVYNWTVLFQHQFNSAADAPAIVQKVLRYDAHVIVASIYENNGAVLLCEAHNQGIAPPDRIWVLASGWWSVDFLPTFADYVKMSVQSYGGRSCSQQGMLETVYGAVLFDRGGMLETEEAHGLSGRKLRDVKAQYYAECQAFAGGLGACHEYFSGYFYDGLWEWAWLLKQFLVEEGRPLSSLRTAASREWLFQKALTVDFMGITGRVRHFNGTNPTTSPPSLGDRDGATVVRQITGLREQSIVALWSRDGGFKWSAPLLWSLRDPAVRLPCAGESCQPAAGWVPADRNTTCAAGSIWGSETGCVPCPVGTAAGAGAAACAVCGAGQFSNANGQSQCSPCPPGHFGKDVGASKCSECAEGTLAEATGAVRCELCPRGYYTASARALSCDACAAGLTTLEAGSRSQELCVCTEGSYRSLEGTCMACPDGMVCPAGSEATSVDSAGGSAARRPRLLPRFWAAPAEPLSVYRCSSEQACPGGNAGTCGVNLEDIACGACKAGFQLERGICAACNSVDSSGVLYPWMILLLGPGLVALVYRHSQSDPSSWGDWKNSITTLGFVGLRHYQALGIVTAASVLFPKVVADSFVGWTYILELSDILRPGCSSLRGFRSGFTVRVTLPLLGLAVFVVAWVCSRLAGLYRARFILDVNVLFNIYMSVLQAFYVSVASMALKLFMCYPHPNGKSSLVAAPEVLCNEGAWQEMMGLAVAAIAVYVVALTAVIAYVIYVAPSRFCNVGFQKRWKFLFLRFKPSVWWWTLPIMIQGLCLNLSQVVFQDGVLQYTSILLTVVAYVMALGELSPWRHGNANILDKVAGVSIMFITSMSLMYTRASHVRQDTTPVLMVVMSFFPMFLMVLFFLRLVCAKLSPAAAGRRGRRKEGEAQRLRAACAALLQVPESTVEEGVLRLANHDLKTLQRARVVILAEFFGQHASRKWSQKRLISSRSPGLSGEQHAAAPRDDAPPAAPWEDAPPASGASEQRPSEVASVIFV